MKTQQIDSPTKEKMMRVAEKLMIDKGFVATTVDEICEAAGVTKGSFFHYFKGKDELGKLLIERFSKNTHKMMENSCCGTDDPLERIYGFIDFALEVIKNPNVKGCLVGTFAQEISETHPELKSCCAKGFDEGAEFFKKEFAKAKTKYAPKADFDAESLGDYFVALMQGIFLVRRTKKDNKSAEKVLNHFRRYVKILYGK